MLLDWHHGISVNGISNQVDVQVGDYGNVTGIVESDSTLIVHDSNWAWQRRGTRGSS